MKISDYRHDFTVMVVESDIDSGAAAHAILYRERYQVEAYYDYETALQRIRAQAPHIVVIGINTLPRTLQECIDEIHGISPEILIIGATREDTLSVVRGSVGKGLYDFLIKPLISAVELLGAVDKAAEKLYFQYTNEQLFDQLNKLSQLRGTSFVEGTPEILSNLDFSVISNLLADFKNVSSHNQLIDLSVKWLSRQNSNSTVLFLKWVPGHSTLVVADSAGVDVDMIRGVGAKLDNFSLTQQEYFLRHPHEIAALKNLANEAFQSPEYFASPLISDQKIEGIWMVMNCEVQKCGQMHFFMNLIELIYHKIALSKRLYEVDPYEANLGQVLNKRFFVKAVHSEVTRCRRIHLPVSLILVDIDKQEVLLIAGGELGFEFFMKSILNKVKESSRNQDIIGRIGNSEIGLLLPHTELKGAVIKAERLRQSISELDFEFIGVKNSSTLNTSVSVGVSEYPMLSLDADGLLESAFEAMLEVQKSGGNCVCQASVGEGFQSDFTPLAVIDTSTK